MKPGIDYIGISVGFICHDGQGRMLLHKRSNKTRDEHGTWDGGGGRLEHGETPEQGVLRELKEEHGCDGIIEYALPPLSLHREWGNAKTHWITFPFFIKVNPDDVQILDTNAIDGMNWFTFNELPNPLHTGFQKIFETYEKEFKQYFKP